jgi:hypothetical protein
VPQFTFGVFAANVNGFSLVSTGILRFFSVFYSTKGAKRAENRLFWAGAEEQPCAAAALRVG